MKKLFTLLFSLVTFAIVAQAQGNLVLPTGVTFDKTELILHLDDEVWIGASVQPSNATNKTLTWTSSNTNVAAFTYSADNGCRVKAVGEGTATITAKTSNGKTATCSITVKNVILVTSVIVSPTSMRLNEGETAWITATVLPENATDKSLCYWVSYEGWDGIWDDEAGDYVYPEPPVSVSEDGMVTALKSGKATIYVGPGAYKWDVPYCLSEVDVLKLFARVEVTVVKNSSGTLGTQGKWEFADGVLTITYNGQMPQNCTRETNDPEVAYRLKWIDFLADINEVVVKGQDVEVQPYFLYYESDETSDHHHPDDHIKKLTLGSGVKSIGRCAFSLYELNRVDCYKKEPPTTASQPVFWNNRLTNNTAWLHLVSGASTNYDNNDPWRNFNPRILRDLSYADDPDLRLPVSITLDKTCLEFNELEQTYRLTATVYPSNATDKTVTWTTSNMSVATVSSTGLVRAVGPGKATITAKTINGIRATCEVRVGLFRNGTMGDQGFWEFANGVLTIDYQGAMPEITKSTTDPEIAYRLQWEEFLDEINEVVVMGSDVEIQPYFLYFEGDGPDGSHPNDHITRVTLCSGVKFIGDRALSLYSLTELLCYGEEPPVLASDNSSSCKCFWKARVQANEAWLYTLPDVFMNYSLAGGEWSYFKIMGDLSPEDDPVGIRRPTSEPTLDGGEKRGWYNLAGQRVNPQTEEDGRGLHPGLYIKDGKKVLIK